MQEKILVSGASGLIGTNLVIFLRDKGHHVVRLVRKPTQENDTIAWNPESGVVKTEKFEGFSAVVHLAGANIAAKRWTRSRMHELFQSRCRDTWLLAYALARVKKPPQTFISASAVGYYGDRGQETLTEQSAPGTGFLADLCEQWEKATDVLQERGTRVVHTRFGSLITQQGGIVKKLLPLFKIGLGAIMSKGDQWFSWIGCDDAVSALYHVLKTKELEGPVNVTSPNPVRSRDFSLALARLCHRPLLFRLPAPLLHLGLGVMADELLLASTRAMPRKLEESGFAFKQAELDEALSLS